MSAGEEAEERREHLRRRILAGGFDRVGFARAERAPEAEHFLAWLSRGDHADLDYMERGAERRCDPRRLQPRARTVIALALHYRPPQPPLFGARLPLRISAYALGEDYHRVMERRLKALCAALRAEFPGEMFYWNVDVAPVLERSWAQAAGVAWIGRNAMAIDSERGSFFFLATVLTSLELPPDAPQTNHCGACRACLDACPTEAIVEPFRVDARRCLSYVTIESRGAFPADFRPALGTLVFGCDICQEVCPFNRLGPGGDLELEPREENVTVDDAALVESLADEASFQRRFSRSAVRRAGREGLLRNVAVAIAHKGGPAARGLLGRLRQLARGASRAAADAIAWAEAALAAEGSEPAPKKERLAHERARPAAESGDPKGI